MKAVRTMCKKVLCFFVSLTLAIGLIPATAFAEAAKVVPSDDGDSHAAAVAVADSGQGQAPDGRTAGQGDGAVVSEGEQFAQSAASQPGADAAVVLSVQNDNVVAMSLGQSYAAAIAQDEYWVGSFTAPEYGLYSFISEGSDDTFGTLFSDRELQNEVAYNDDGAEGNNFQVDIALNAGQTVYLQAKGYNFNAVNCTVSVAFVNPHDLATAELSLDSDAYSLMGNDVSIIATVTDCAGKVLREGTDYELVYYNWDTDEELAGAPTSIGSYYAIARGKAGSEYTGETDMRYFTVYDLSNIASAWGREWEGDDMIAYTGKAVVLPQLSVYRYDDEIGDYAYLSEGTDFRLSYFEDNAGTRLTQTPVNPGEYRAVYEGISPYSGSVKMYFCITGGEYNLSFASIELYEYLFDYSGEPVEPYFNVYDAYDEDVSNDAYDAVYYDKNGAELSSAPREAGEYFVAARARAGMGYEGETAKRSFTVVGTNDLRHESYSVYWIGPRGNTVVADPNGIEPPTVGISYWDQNTEEDIDLEQGVDYEFSGFKGMDGVPLTQAPTEPGQYYAVYSGIGSYTGFIEDIFRVCDPSDLSGATIHVKNGGVSLWNGVASPEVTVTSISGDVLALGTDYVLQYYAEDDETDDYVLLPGEPTEIGYYYVAAVPGSNGAYFGETYKRGFSVYDAFDIGGDGFQCYFNGRNAFPSGTTIALSPVRIVDHDGMELTEGTDFVFYGYENENGVALAQAPTETGTYRAVYKGVGSFRGMARVYFAIQDSHDLGYADIDVYDYQVVLSGGVAAPSVTVTDLAGNDLSLGVDFTLRYCSYDEETGEEAQLPGPPTTEGCFLVYAVPANGSTYFNETYKTEFRVFEANNIGRFPHYFTGNHGNRVASNESGIVLPPLSVYGSIDGDNTELSEGTDYEFSHFEDKNGVALTKPPTTVGSYYAVYRGIGSYSGTLKAYFMVCDVHDLSSASLDLSTTRIRISDGGSMAPTVTVTDLAGTRLVEGTDYALRYYYYDNGTYDYVQLAGPPTEVGDYYVSAVANGGKYTGESEHRWFEVCDPYDLSSNAYIYLVDSAYNDASDNYVPVYCYEGTPVTPSLYVYSDSRLDSSAYTVSYADNDKVSTNGSYATITVTGNEPYRGTLTQKFKIVETLDLPSMITNRGCRFTAGSESAYISGTIYPTDFLATGAAINPNVVFYDYGSGDSGNGRITPLRGRDFTVTYTDDSGNAVVDPTAVGSYWAVVTATPGGVFTGTARIPFNIVGSRSLSGVYPSLKSDGLFTYSTRHDASGTTYQINDVESNVGALSFSLSYNGKELIEGLDYLVESTFDSAESAIRYVFTGTGSFTGSIQAKARFADNEQEAFATHRARYASSVREIIYDGALIDENGRLETPALSMDGLVAGVDFLVDGFFDRDGRQVTSASVGDVVYLTIHGLGDYDGCVSGCALAVRQSLDAFSLAGDGIVFSLTNGMHLNDGDAEWSLLSSVNPAVSLVVYGRNMLTLTEGNGFTVSKNVVGNDMTLTLEATDGSPLKGSVTKKVKLVDSYDLGMVDTVQVGDLAGNTSFYTVGSTTPASIAYSGVPYMPTFSLSSNDYRVPEQDVTLLDSAGHAVSQITGEGAYTARFDGVNGWSGQISVPIEVFATDADIDLSTCRMTIGDDTALVNGAAKPSVALTCGNYTLKEGVDYTLEYGNNTAKGANAWVKATAVSDSEFTGVRTSAFTVTGDASTVLSKLDYELYLQLPSGTGFGSAAILRTYTIGEGQTGVPAVMVMKKGANNSRTVLDASKYSVEYGNTSRSGLGYVTVTGVNGYTGSMSANFYVISTASQEDAITVQPQDVTCKVGDTFSFTVATTGDVESYRWQQSKDGGKSWRNVSGAAGAAATFTYSPMSETLDGRMFRCVVAFANGNTSTSEAATLTLASGPAITSQPKDATVAPGATAKFTVVATGEGLTYKWYLSADGGKKWKATSATGATLSFKATAKLDGYQFKCVVADKDGNKVISEAATLTLASGPAITAQPKDATVAPGATAKFTVVATGEGLTYKWYLSADGGKKWKATSATGATLSFKATTKLDGYQFKCVVADKDGNKVISEAATLTVAAGPAITTQPQDATVALGATATFTVEATGEGLTYKWYLSADGGKTWKATSAEGATASCKATAKLDGYQFKCVVADKDGNSATSEAAKLTVAAGPAITAQPKDYSAVVGETFSFSVAATGDVESYRWQQSKDNGKSWRNVSGAAGAAATLTYGPMTDSLDGRMFRCVVALAGGEELVSNAATLSLK